MSTRRSLPSGGFLFLIGSWLFLAGFLSWGFSRPALDEVWALLERMEQREFDGLTDEDVSLLRASMSRHQELLIELAGKDQIGLIEPTEGGWSALPVTHYIMHGEPQAKRRFIVESRAHERAYPITISLEASEFSKQLRFESNAQQTFELEAGQLLAPTIVRVVVTAALPSETGARPFEINFDSEIIENEQESQ